MHAQQPLVMTGFVPDEALLQEILADSSALHRHLCPRQVLGARIGLAGLRALDLLGSEETPRFWNRRKRLLAVVETDGCGADGVAAATNCWVGRRTLRVVDYGKVAATLVDVRNGRAVRVAPRAEVRDLAIGFAPDAPSRWHAYLTAYQIMPDDLLLRVEPVALTQSLAEIISRPNLRALCDTCGEEVMNEREVWVNGRVLCRACAEGAYYRPIS